MKKCLTVDPDYRLTASQGKQVLCINSSVASDQIWNYTTALAHPWLSHAPANRLNSVTKSLKDYVVKRKLKGAVNVVIAVEKLKKNAHIEEKKA